MKKYYLFGLVIPLLFFLTACKDNVSYKIDKYLEETAQLEKEFAAHQEKILELEKTDEELYEEIILLGDEEEEKVKQLVSEAMVLLEERLTYIKLERTSLEDAKTTFQHIEPLISSLPDKERKKILEEMYEAMSNRYDAYEKVYEHYYESVQLTKELYGLLKEEEFDEVKVYSLLSDVNKSYESVNQANELFNGETIRFNELKEDFYEKEKMNKGRGVK